MSERSRMALMVVWQVGSVATFGRLTFFDGFTYNWWNWMIVVPLNAFLGEIWPLYWLIVRPLMSWLHS